MKKQNQENGSGIIDERRVYTVRSFCRELGIARGNSAYQRLLRMGLKVRGNKYIHGRDFSDVILNWDDNKEEATTDANESQTRPAGPVRLGAVE